VDANGPDKGGARASQTVCVQLHCRYSLSEKVSTDPVVVEDDAPMADASAAARRVMEETCGILEDGEQHDEAGTGWVVGEGGGEVQVWAAAGALALFSDAMASIPRLHRPTMLWWPRPDDCHVVHGGRCGRHR
jgi:hypothetical protein